MQDYIPCSQFHQPDSTDGSGSDISRETPLQNRIFVQTISMPARQQGFRHKICAKMVCAWLHGDSPECLEFDHYEYAEECIEEVDTELDIKYKRDLFSNDELLRLVNKVSGENVLSANDVSDWLRQEQTLPVYESISDQQLLNSYALLQLPVPDGWESQDSDVEEAE